jgi:hypothetical protein
VDGKGAAIGALLTLEPPSQAMKVEAAKAGFYESSLGSHPRLQILTAEQVLGGSGIDHPGVNVTAARQARRTPAGNGRTAMTRGPVKAQVHAPPRVAAVAGPGTAR